MKGKISKIWLESVQDEWKKMAIHLSTSVPEGQIHDRLFDQLSWLKEQIDEFQPESDPTILRECFNEVVESFNEELKLKQGTIFPKQ